MTEVYKIVEDRIKYNSQDFGEMGKFIRIEYALNIIRKALDEKKEKVEWTKCDCIYYNGIITKCAIHLKEEPKPECVKENGYFVCYCGKCEPDNYPLPADFPKQPKSTLREATLKIVRTVADLQAEPVADKIISLFKDTLLKEVKKAEPLRLPGESLEFISGQEWTVRQIKQIIKNI